MSEALKLDADPMDAALLSVRREVRDLLGALGCALVHILDARSTARCHGVAFDCLEDWKGRITDLYAEAATLNLYTERPRPVDAGQGQEHNNESRGG